MRRILLLTLAAGLCFGQKTTFPTASVQLFDNSGNPCIGCKLYTYAAGGTTPQATYTSASGGGANANPVVMDSAGRANIWTTPGLSYRFDLYDASAVLIWSVDNIPGGSLAGTSSVNAHYVFIGPTSSTATPTFRALVASDIPAITPTTCTNQVVNAISTTSVGTCHTVAGTDFGASVAARAHLGTAASIAAPSMSTTVDSLAYQVAEIPSFVFVASDFTTSGVGTALELITGLTWTIPANTALNVPFTCEFTYSQAVANDAVAFGIQDVTVSPTNIAGRGVIYTNTTASTEGNLATLTTTSATAIVSATPAATGTNFYARISGLIEAPSNASSSAIKIMVSTATAADLVTIRRGSSCRMN